MRVKRFVNLCLDVQVCHAMLVSSAFANLGVNTTDVMWGGLVRGIKTCLCFA